MKIVLQRVKEASVSVDGSEEAAIGRGFLLLVGIAQEDGETQMLSLADKVSKLRIFEDKNGKMNLDIKEEAGEILSVPQFTLLGDTDKGNRPGFDRAAPPDKAKVLWQDFNEALRQRGLRVKEGVFGAHMEVALVNDGPVTFVVESKRG